MREIDVPQIIQRPDEMGDLRQKLLREKRGVPPSLRRYYAGVLHHTGRTQGIEAARSFVENHTGEQVNGQHNDAPNSMNELRGAALYANGNGDHQSLLTEQQTTTTTTTKP